MADIDPNDPRLPDSKGAGCWFFVLPIAFAVIMIGGYASLLVAGYFGRPADGDRVELTYAACPEAKPIMEKRVHEMGLGDPAFLVEGDRVRLAATLPSNPVMAESIPKTLAAMGAFVIEPQGGGVPLATDENIDDARIRLDVVANPGTAIVLDDAATKAIIEHMKGAPEGKVIAKLDGVQVWERANTPMLKVGKLELETTKETLEEGTAQTAEWGIVLNNGRYPCTVTLEDKKVVEAFPGE